MSDKQLKIIRVLFIIALFSTASTIGFAQCDPRFTGATYTGTSAPNNVGTILVGEQGQLKFNFGVGPQPTCNATAGNTAGTLTVTIQFPAEYAPTSAADISGPQAALYNWTWDPATRRLIGVNNAAIPTGGSPTFTVNVTGTAATPGTSITLTSLTWSSTTTPPITNASTANDALTAGLNVDPAAAAPPVATADTKSIIPNDPTTIDILTNDTPGSTPINPGSVLLIDPADGQKKTSVTIPGEGTYTVDPVTGVVTFDPEDFVQNFTSTIQYTIKGNDGSESVPALITVNVGPLPVKLISFSAAKEGTVAQLAWATSEETNSDRFEIERSLNGKNWNYIGEVKSSGESKGTKKYAFTDSKPAFGENLYRLKMVDKDLSFAYSRIQGLTFKGEQLTASVYPNPAVERLYVQGTDLASIQQVSLLDLTGRSVYSAKSVSKDGINVSTLPAGMYILNVKTLGGTSSALKVLISK